MYAALLVALTLSAQTRAPEERTWTVEGQERKALVVSPSKKEGKPPLVFVFHGHGGTSRNVARSFHIHTLWPEAVVVYPQGLPTPGLLTDPEGKRAGWQHSPGVKGDRDLKFFDAMLADLRKEYSVDESRVYSTGHSNGGGFTYLLGATRPGVFAALAPSAAGLGGARRAAGKPEPCALMHLAGRKDPLVKFAWQERSMQAVREINGCTDESEPWGDDPRARLYPSSKNAPFVAFIHDGTHQFPSEGPALIVRFFKEQVRPSAKPVKAD
ncbi:MAG: acetylxylan esterase [Isosphaeraceae bacterium]